MLHSHLFQHNHSTSIVVLCVELELFQKTEKGQLVFEMVEFEALAESREVFLEDFVDIGWKSEGLLLLARGKGTRVDLVDAGLTEMDRLFLDNFSSFELALLAALVEPA
jgi:hypothetical protein